MASSLALFSWLAILSVQSFAFNTYVELEAAKPRPLFGLVNRPKKVVVLHAHPQHESSKEKSWLRIPNSLFQLCTGAALYSICFFCGVILLFIRSCQISYQHSLTALSLCLEDEHPEEDDEVEELIERQTDSTIEAIQVAANETGLRVDQLLASHFLAISRSRIQRACKQGLVEVNGQMQEASFKVALHDTVTFQDVEGGPAGWVAPEPTPLRVYYEDAGLLVVEKPAGMPVQPSASRRTGTLVNAVLGHLNTAAQASPAVGEALEIAGDPGDTPLWGGPLRHVYRKQWPGLVHRLDAGTSGVMVVAKMAGAEAALRDQFRRRTAARTYLALLHGVPIPAEGRIPAAIGRHPRLKDRMAVTGDGRAAVTRYRTLEAFAGATLVQFRLETGRTHQVRVHAAHLGHPLLGDATYHTPAAPPAPAVHAVAATLGRPALHAHTLAFAHPTTGATLTFTSPVPPDLVDAVRALRSIGS